MKHRLAVMVELYEDGQSDAVIEVAQLEAVRRMAHLLNTCNMPRRGSETLPSGATLRWSFKETETRQ